MIDSRAYVTIDTSI